MAILDFNRPKEAEFLLKSLEKNAKFEHEVVYLSNGGEQEYVWEFYEQGRIDKLILNKKGNGCGLGTRQLFQSCMGEWILYVQVDQFLFQELNEIHISQMIDALQKNPNSFYVDMANNQGHGKFSERAGFFERKRYLTMPKIDEIVGGPGPHADKQWTENYVQEYMAENGLTYFTGNGCFFFGDNGGDSVRENPDGSKWKHFTDTKSLFLISGPVKEKFSYPNFTDEEWEDVLLNQKWPDGQIPIKEKPYSFEVWHKK